MQKRSIITILTLLILFLLVPTACKNKNVSELEGTRWTLVEINGSGLIEGTYISLSFYRGTVEGNGGCNNYSGKYIAEKPDILNIQAPEHTDEGCLEPEGVTEQEKAYFNTLSNVATYEIINDSLVIYGQDDQKLLVFQKRIEFKMNPADLVGTVCQLESMNDKPVPDRLSITLVFDTSSEATGRAGCFSYMLPYTAEGDRLSWGMSTRRDGELPQELEMYALDYTDNIAKANQYNLAGEQLEIFTSKGDVLVYKRVTQ